MIIFEFSIDLVKHTRKVYNYFDLLGDVGGLAGIIQGFGQIFISMISFLSGSSLNRFVLSKILKRESSKYLKNQPNNSTLEIYNTL